MMPARPSSTRSRARPAGATIPALRKWRRSSGKRWNADGRELAVPRLTGFSRRHGGVLLVVLALVAVLAGCWLLYLHESRRIGDQQREREVLRVGLLAQLMRSELAPVVETLRLLADGDGLRN